jgi:hypothetical protein
MQRLPVCRQYCSHNETNPEGFSPIASSFAPRKLYLFMDWLSWARHIMLAECPNYMRGARSKFAHRLLFFHLAE